MVAKNINDLLGREVTNKDYYNLQEIVVAENVENIFPHAFHKFRKLTSVILSNSVIKIEAGAFYGCRHLDSIVISESVQEIEPGAFNGWKEIESIVVNKNNKTYDSRDNCNAIIRTKDNTLIVGCANSKIPNGVKKIDSRAFNCCPGIRTVTIPETLHVFSINTFKNRDSILSIEVDKNNSIFDSRDNCNAIIRKNGNRLIFGCNISTIPYGIEMIDYCAFSECTNMESVVIPNSVHTIGSLAFRGCTNLTSITLSDSITSICEAAFQDCGKLDKILIPGSVECICSKAFYGCVKLTSVIISEGVKILSAEVFSACCNLETIYFPQSIEKVDVSAFQYCNNLKSLIVPKGAKERFEVLLPKYVDKIVEK